MGPIIRTARTDETFMMNIQGFIETNDGATIILDYQGYGRSLDRSQELYQKMLMVDEKRKRRRQIVGFGKHVTGSEKYRWLNDAVCAIAGEVRAPVGVPPEQIKQADVRLVCDVAELVWETRPNKPRCLARTTLCCAESNILTVYPNHLSVVL